MNIDIEKLLPHRNTMKLIGEVVEVNDERCITASTVSSRWPLFSDGHVDPLILIELAAQTAGVNFGWHKMMNNSPVEQLGWIVGIKNAEFYLGRIPLDAKIVVSVEEKTKSDNYVVIAGTAHVGPECIGRMELQVYRAEYD